MALILIADDDEIVVDIVREAFAARGHYVGAVDDGLPVIGVVESKRPDLVILDCNMPEISGLEALRQIRLSITCFATPVLMLTGCLGEVDEWIAKRSGSDDYLRKPFDTDQLVARAEALIEHAKAARKPKAPQPTHSAPTSSERRWGQR